MTLVLYILIQLESLLSSRLNLNNVPDHSLAIFTRETVWPSAFMGLETNAAFEITFLVLS